MKTRSENGLVLVKYKYLILFITFIFSLLRFINLDADSGMFTRIGSVGDEGYYGAEARNFVLYGQWIVDEFTQASATAPLYTLLSTIFFKIFGVSLYVSRLTSAIFGGLTILSTYIFLKKYDKNIALWSSLCLAANFHYFAFNRLGLVETLVSFFLLLTFYCFEKRDCWFGAAISYALAVWAKMTAIWFFPAILLYIVFKFVRNEVSIRKIFHFVGGGLVLGIPFLWYHIHFRTVFKPTLEGLSPNLLSGVIPTLRLLFGAPLNMKLFLTNPYFVNPINSFLVVCLVIYLNKIGFLHLFSRNFGKYVRLLDPLDLIILSWIIGYAITLILASDLGDRRLRLFCVILSIVPGVLLFRNNKKEVCPTNFEALNIFQQIIWLLPFIILGALLGQQILLSHFYDMVVSYFQYPYRSQIILLYVSGGIILATVIVMSRLAHRLPKNWGKVLSILSFVSLVVLINVRFIDHIAHIFGVSMFSKMILLVIFSGLFVMFGYAVRHKVYSVNIILVISSALIFVELATPTFAQREVSRHLSEITTSKDYVAGPLTHMVSFEAEYHPVLWRGKFSTMKILKDINSNYVREVKPEFFNYCEDWNWNGFGFGTAYPDLDELRGIGAVGFEKVYSYGLFPILGKARAIFSLYRVHYSEAK